MANHISIRALSGTWVARAAGAIIGESKRAIELTEGSYPPVIYFPREDIAMAFLERSDTTSVCTHKGTASHYAIIAKSGAIPDAAWSYEDPIATVAEIREHLAFYPDKVTVEEV